MNRPLIRPGRHLVSQAPVHAPNAALLIDFDNVTLGIQKDLTKELRTLLNSDIIKGKVAVQRAYADWRRYPQYIVPLSESSIDLIFAPAFGSTKKNATDIRLAIDAVELIFTRPEIGTFILLSGDSDFSTMVIKLKEYGKYVIGVGIRESASDLLIQNCDEYYSYNDLAGLTKEVDTPSIQRDPWELAGVAVAQMARNGDVMRSDRLKQVMQQIDPNFDERNAGFNRFSKFVLEAGQRGVVTVTKLDNGQFEVGPGTAAPAAAAAAPAAPATTREREAEYRNGREDGRSREDGRGRRGRRGRGRERERPEGGREAARESTAKPRSTDGVLSLARAFQLLTEALGELRGPVNQEALRLRMSALHGREDPLLDSARFPRLLRQANDAEIADVRKVGEDDYEITARRGMLPPHSPQPASVPVAPSPAEVEPAAAAVSSGDAEPVVTEPAGASRENGVRFGVRFRRGSRGGLRTAEYPLVGVVQIDEPQEAVTASPAAVGVESAEPGEAAARPARPRRAPRKKTGTTRAEKARAEKPAKAEVTAPVLEGEGATPAPPKRPRTRTRKKAE